MNNLTELSKKVYQLQIEKGWCKPDEKRDVETLKILILSEAFEAFEAYRKNQYSPNTKELIILQEVMQDNPITSDVLSFKKAVKDTFQDEIADVAIRALDLAGYLEIDFNGVIFEDIPTYQTRLIGEDYPSVLALLTSYISDYTHLPNSDDRLLSWFEFKVRHRPTGRKFVSNILSWCKTVARKFDFDLMQHIELKLAYNKTRPFRHGNKVV